MCVCAGTVVRQLELIGLLPAAAVNEKVGGDLDAVRGLLGRRCTGHWRRASTKTMALMVSPHLRRSRGTGYRALLSDFPFIDGALQPHFD